MQHSKETLLKRKLWAVRLNLAMQFLFVCWAWYELCIEHLNLPIWARIVLALPGYQLWQFFSQTLGQMQREFQSYYLDLSHYEENKFPVSALLAGLVVNCILCVLHTIVSIAYIIMTAGVAIPIGFISEKIIADGIYWIYDRLHYYNGQNEKA